MRAKNGTLPPQNYPILPKDCEQWGDFGNSSLVTQLECIVNICMCSQHNVKGAIGKLQPDRQNRNRMNMFCIAWSCLAAPLTLKQTMLPTQLCQ